MSASPVEHVLAIPTARLHEAGHFHGFTPDVDRYLPHLLDPAYFRYLPRPEAEVDPTWKQLIPYIVLRCGDQVFHYTRGGKGSETRLRALRSLGVGGHICAEDGLAADDPYRAGMLRELTEEIDLLTPYRETCLGLINDDTLADGQVHLGIVHLLDLDEPRVQRRETVLDQAGFAPLAELCQQRDQFETWSQFLLDGGWLRIKN